MKWAYNFVGLGSNKNIPLRALFIVIIVRVLTSSPSSPQMPVFRDIYLAQRVYIIVDHPGVSTIRKLFGRNTIYTKDSSSRKKCWDSI